MAQRETTPVDVFVTDDIGLRIEAVAWAIIAELEREQERLNGEDYSMDTADCISIIREKFCDITPNPKGKP